MTWSQAEGIAEALRGRGRVQHPVPGPAARRRAHAELTNLVRTAEDLLDAGSAPANVAADPEGGPGVLLAEPGCPRPHQPAGIGGRGCRPGGLPARGRHRGRCTSRSSAPAGTSPARVSSPTWTPGRPATRSNSRSSGAGAARLLPASRADGPDRMKSSTPRWRRSRRPRTRSRSPLTVGPSTRSSVSARPSTRPTRRAFRGDRPVPGGGACPITLYASGVSLSLAAYRQSVAHEAFHCLQDRNFSTAPFEVNAWWVEGSAEYFSDVVYPDVDLEHRQIGPFDRGRRPRPPRWRTRTRCSSSTTPTVVVWTGPSTCWGRSRPGGRARCARVGRGHGRPVAGVRRRLHGRQVVDTNGGQLPPGERVTSRKRVDDKGP